MRRTAACRSLPSAACLALLLAGCAAYPRVPCAPHVHPALGDMTAHYGIVRLMYATDRRPVGGPVPALYYGVDRDRALHLGTCDVSIPAGHVRGRLETPLPLLWPDPRHHVMLLAQPAVLEADEFVAELDRRLRDSPGGDVLVFIHGYYTSFHDAVRLTAQIAHDVDFAGVAVCYSWPSEAWLLGYLIDGGNAEWTIPHLRDFLQLLIEHGGAKRIHILAHSMGARTLARAVRELSLRRIATGPPWFENVVLAAADVDTELFERDYADWLSRSTRRLTLYVSTADLALGGSRLLHKYTRLGQTGPLNQQAAWLANCETIDATAVDHGAVGHVYYARSPTVLRDLAGLLAGRSAAQRGLPASDGRYLLAPAYDPHGELLPAPATQR